MNTTAINTDKRRGGKSPSRSAKAIKTLIEMLAADHAATAAKIAAKKEARRAARAR